MPCHSCTLRHGPEQRRVDRRIAVFVGFTRILLFISPPDLCLTCAQDVPDPLIEDSLVLVAQ